jgi:hypothetical protein
MDKVLEEEKDHLIEPVSKRSRLFYDKYIAARGIRNLGGGKKPGKDEPTPPTPPAQ